MKLNEITLEKFEGMVRTQLKPTVKDASLIIKTIYDKSGSYQIATAMRSVKSALDKAKQLEDATTITGIIIGTLDRKGSKAMMSMAVLCQRQAHKKIRIFDMKVPYSDGSEAQLVFPAVAKIAIAPGRNGEPQLVQIVGYKKTEGTDLLEKINKQKAIATANSIREPVNDFEGGVFTHPIATLTGEIVDVFALQSSKYGVEPQTFWNVLEDDERKVSSKHPAMNIKIKTDYGATIFAKVSPRRYSKGYYAITDLEQICENALADDDPKTQAEYVSGVLSGLKVLVVGAVTNIKENEKYGKTISMDTYAIIETEHDVAPTEFVEQQTLEQETPSEQPIEQPIDTDILTKTKEFMLWKIGIAYDAKSIEGKKKVLKGLSVEDDVVGKLHMDDWVIVEAKKNDLEIDKDTAKAIVEQVYEELTRN